MAAPHTVQTLPMGVPTGGVNFRDPLFNMPPQFSPFMVNFDAEDQFLKLRGSYRQLVNGYGANETILQTNDSGHALTLSNTDSKLRVYNTTPTAIFTSTSTYSTSGSYRTRWFRHAGYEYFLHNDGTLKFNGTSWSEDSFTYSASDLTPSVATSFKGRAYLVDDDTKIYYSPLGAVQGETTEWDVTELLDNSAIAWIGSLTSPSGRASDNYLAFGTFDGLCLVYSGDYPDSGNWEIVGKFDIPSVASYQSILEYQNDIWVATAAGIVSIRRLFLSGFEPDEVFVTQNIEPVWKLLLKKANAEVAGSPTFSESSSVAMAYNANANRVMVRVGGRVITAFSVDGDGATHFVFNPNTGSWSIHTINEDSSEEYYDAPQSLIAYGDTFAFISDESVMYLRNGYYADEPHNSSGNTDYTAELHSAYQAFGSTSKHKHVKTIEPIIKTDLDGGDIEASCAADFGRNVSGATSQDIQSGYAFPVYQAGAKGSFIQYRLEVQSGAESSDGFEIYAVSVGVL